ncbi:ABC transporter substrate-binding protein [Sphingomonas sp.]|uniref:ABC transporter substrate-binding protein n=1 Tax=Sphingomonas sp. TaxID=28214 RepID=UPI003B00B805
MRRHPLALAIALAMPAVARAQSDPVARVTAYDARINAIEKAGGGQAQRTDKFEAVVRDTYDMPTIAELIAGSAWAKASPADRQAAIAALTRHSAASLAKNFKGPGATAFRVDPTPIDRAGSRIVKVTVGTDTLFYRFGRAGIVDVISGGVSNLALQRADLAATLASGGVAAMTAKLRQLDAAK